VELSAASMSEQGKREAGKTQLGHTRKGKRGGGPVWAMLGGGRERTGPIIPATARERWRRAPVGRCLIPCGSKGVGSARGLRVSTWAGRGRKELGRARENSADLD
jgi:hypothetical protein